MNRNVIVGSLIGFTGVLFAAATVIGINTTADVTLTGNLFSLGVISGISAVTTRLLIKENN